MDGRPHPVRAREYHFLNVYTKEQGTYRLRLVSCVLVWLVFTALYWMVTEYLPLNVQDSDTRDHFDDWRQTLPGLKAGHAFFPPSGLQLTLDGFRPALSLEEETNGNFRDPRMSTKAGMTYINNAAYTRAWMAGTATVGAPDDYDPYALLRVGAFGDQFVDVAWFRPEIDYDEATTDVAVVSGLDVTVVRLDGDWFLLDVAVSYAQVLSGTALDRVANELGGLRVEIAVEVNDASAPPHRGWPAFKGFRRFFIGVLMLTVAAFGLCPTAYLCYKVRKHYALNNSLPPPFFKSMTRFRGW